MSAAKRHHYVPQWLLRRFADANEQVEVTRLEGGAPYLSTARDLGHRNHGHTLYLPGRNPDSTSLEAKMSELEAVTAEAVAELDTLKGSLVPTAIRDMLEWFISLQWHRNRYILGYVRATMARERPDEDSEALQDIARSAGLISGLSTLLEAWKHRDDPTADPKDRWDSVVSSLMDFQWRVCRYQRDVLVVADTTVALSGVRAGHPSDAPDPWPMHGVGVGFSNCRRITVALGPRLGLILDHDQAPTHLPAARFNQLTVASSREFVAHEPGWAEREPQLARQFRRNVAAQRFIYPVLMSPFG